MIPASHRVAEIMAAIENAAPHTVRDHRCLQPLGDGTDAWARILRAAADENHGLSRRGEKPRGARDRIVVDRRIGERHQWRRGLYRHLAGENVGRDLETDRSRSARIQHAEGLGGLARTLVRDHDAVRPFGQGPDQLELLRDLVQRADAAPDHARRDLPSQAQDRRIGAVCRRQRRHRVKDPRARHHAIDGRPAGRQSGPQRHVGSGLLMANMDRPDLVAGIEQGAEERVVLHPRQTEYPVDAVRNQRLHHAVRAGRLRACFFAHLPPTLIARPTRLLQPRAPDWNGDAHRREPLRLPVRRLAVTTSGRHAHTRGRAVP